MGVMTAQAALENAKDLTFEKVWLMFQEIGKRADEDRKRADEDRKRADEDRKRADEDRKRADEEFAKLHEQNEKRLAELREQNDKRLAELHEKNDKRLAELREKNDKRLAELREKDDKRLAELHEQNEKRFAELRKKNEKELAELRKQTEEAHKRAEESKDELDKKMGELTNRFGEIAEHLVAPGIIKRFNELGYHFNDIVIQNVKIKDDQGRDLTEIDLLCENGEYSIATEVKAYPTVKVIQRHEKQLEILRAYKDRKGDKRKIRGAIAGAVFPEEIQQAAIDAGFYVIVQSGDTMKIQIPEGFVPRDF